MGWRTVVVDSKSKVSYRGGYIVIKKDKDVLVHIAEIDVLVLSSPQVSFTGMAMAELLKAKVKVILCDEKHNPLGEVMGCRDYYRSSKRLMEQTQWNEVLKGEVTAALIRQKIYNQASLLLKTGRRDGAELLYTYAGNVLPADATNREGHAAKVYFNALFGMDFERHTSDNINAALDYGYSILLSCVNRAVTANGFATQLGIHHCNEFNPFNLSCDLMEPMRPIVDEFVHENSPPEVLEKEYKYKLIGLLNRQITYDGRTSFLTDAIDAYVRNVLMALNKGAVDDLILYEF